MSEGIVVVGGGLAAGTAVQALRDNGFEGPINLITDERHRPYERPPLSKEYLTGAGSIDDTFVHSADWAERNGVSIVTGRVVTDVDAEAHTVTLDNGDSLSYGSLLLATGVAARRLEVAGGRAAGIHYLRTIDDSESLRSALEGGGRRVIVVGSGWIGLEVAAAARGYGNEVTVLGHSPVALGRALGERMGGVFEKIHRDNGVEIRGGVSVTEFVVDGERVTGVRTADGETVPADLVVVGVGAVPNVNLAEKAGAKVEGGIVVDEHMRTSVPDVFAAGDVASSYHPFVDEHLRNEHWANAIDGAKAAAASMLGHEAVFDNVPYFYSDQYDLGMEYAGFGTLARDAEVVVRGDEPGREFIAFWVADGRVVAGMNVNIWDVNDDIKALITSRKKVDAARLADPHVALTDV